MKNSFVNIIYLFAFILILANCTKKTVSKQTDKFYF